MTIAYQMLPLIGKMVLKSIIHWISGVTHSCLNALNRFYTLPKDLKWIRNVKIYSLWKKQVV